MANFRQTLSFPGRLPGRSASAMLAAADDPQRRLRALQRPWRAAVIVAGAA